MNTVNWIDDTLDAKIFFPEDCFEGGSFIAALLEIFLERYTYDNGLAAVHWEDEARMRRRKASVYDGSIVPTQFNPPLAPGELPVERSPVGRSIECGWHPQFLADLQRDPQPEPELFEGIYIL